MPNCNRTVHIIDENGTSFNRWKWPDTLYNIRKHMPLIAPHRASIWRTGSMEPVFRKKIEINILKFWKISEIYIMMISTCMQITKADHKYSVRCKNDKFPDLCNEQCKIRKLPDLSVFYHFIVERDVTGCKLFRIVIWQNHRIHHCKHPEFLFGFFWKLKMSI
jgi:hypothetical protein